MSVERISISQEETFARDVGDPERLHDELGGWRRGSASTSAARGQVARTVTTKVRYPDFSIRTRSTSLPVGTDDAGRIGDLACALLDRALADRPGPLRLVGVGVSGLEEHVQLSLPDGSKRHTIDRTSVTNFGDCRLARCGYHETCDHSHARKRHHEHGPKRVHVVLQSAGVPYEIERQVCAELHRASSTSEPLKRAAA